MKKGTTTAPFHDKDSQNKRILAYLSSGKSLTPLEGLHLFNCLSLTQRIFDLRSKGVPIFTEIICLQSRKHVARYYMKSTSGIL